MNIKEKEAIDKQIAFFNKNALSKSNKYFIPTDAFEWYAISPVLKAMKYIYSSKDDYEYLDYGCGIGDSIEIFKICNGKYPNHLIGVDISDKAILEISSRYDFRFFHINPDSGMGNLNIAVDAAYMIHVLHHSIDHKKIIKDISNAIKPSGKVVIVDIGSKNPFQELGRKVFTLLPLKLKNLFSNDLVLDGQIPEKLPVDIKKIRKYLEDEGFKVNISYSSAIIFIFGWLFKILNVKIAKTNPIINVLFAIDEWISNRVFKDFSVLYLVEAERD